MKVRFGGDLKGNMLKFCGYFYGLNAEKCKERKDSQPLLLKFGYEWLRTLLSITEILEDISRDIDIH